MKVKTSELIGTALDWAVAKCEDQEVYMRNGVLEALWTDGGYSPSTNWAQGGPIIESMGGQGLILMQDKPRKQYGWRSSLDHPAGFFYGPTPLIAGMRCYVASKLGDEVDIPEELI